MKLGGGILLWSIITVNFFRWVGTQTGDPAPDLPPGCRPGRDRASWCDQRRTTRAAPCQTHPDWHTFIDVKISTSTPEAPAIVEDSCAVRSVDPGRVAATAETLIGRDEAARLAEGFKLLGDPNRVRILYALLEGGELCVCDLAAVAEVPETTVSHAMRLLRTAGIVRNRRDGRMIYYRLDDAHVRLLLDLSRQHLAHQDGDS